MTPLLNRTLVALKLLKSYHNHRVVGLDYFPKEGPALVLFNHSLATYDIGLFAYATYQKFGRVPRLLADHFFFRSRMTSGFVLGIGGVDGTMENGRKLLKQGEVVGIAPGGMKESLKPSSKRYQLLWESRKGFARLSLETQAPIIIAVCPRADELYDVYPNRMTKWVYDFQRAPFFLARGLGMSLIPRKIKLTHFVAPPIYPPKYPKNKKERAKVIDDFHQKILNETRALVASAVLSSYGKNEYAHINEIEDLSLI
ncbi:MAG: lysophospholipid acyltransferase family protein [Oligoflexales bacterium]